MATETMAIIEAGGYLSPDGRDVRIADGVAAAVASTRLHLPGEDLTSEARHDVKPVIEVTNETTLSTARRLCVGANIQDPGVACLVFASAKNPGGGFLTGAQAQEESIARASALYPCLRSAREFYDFHRAQRDLLYSNRVIYSPAVPVFRGDDGALLDDPYPVSFLTSAAPNLAAIAHSQPEAAADVPGALGSRADRVLAAAAAHGHRVLVLGAWGCGVFGNDPGVVARMFAAALARHEGRFRRVVFAVLDRRPDTPTYAAFDRVFGNAHPQKAR
jgi:uncharacterized protein (TIGR02452 family)